MSTESRILELFYAEDSKADRLLFELALRELAAPHNLNMAEDGVEAMKMLNALDTYIPDVILLDLKMPLKDGHECLAEIRSNKKFDKTPVVIFSTSTNPNDIDKAYKLGANLYMQKPYSLEEQVALLQKLAALNWEEYFPHPQMDKFVLEASPGQKF